MDGAPTPQGKWRRRAQLIGALFLLACALAAFAYRSYQYRRDAAAPRVHPIVGQARQLRLSGRTADALDLLSLAHRDDPTNAEIALEYATTLYTTGNHQQAAAAVAGLLQTHPEWPQRPDALFLRGLIRRDSGALDDGIHDLETVAAACPDNPAYLYALAHALLMRSAREVALTAAAQADMDRAADLLERAAALAPEQLEILSDLALLQKKRSQWDRAIANYELLAELLPAEAGPLAAAAECYLAAGDPERAAAVARAAARREPHYAPAHEQLARALQKLPAESVDAEEYKRALRSWWNESDAASAVPALWLAKAHLRDGDARSAEAALREAIEDENARRRVPAPEIHAQLGGLLRDTGRNAEAERELAEARRLHQDWDPVGDLMNRISARPADSRAERLEIARLCRRLGWPEKGVPYLEPLLNADPPDAEAERLAAGIRRADQ